MSDNSKKSLEFPVKVHFDMTVEPEEQKILSDEIMQELLTQGFTVSAGITPTARYSQGLGTLEFSFKFEKLTDNDATIKDFFKSAVLNSCHVVGKKNASDLVLSTDKYDNMLFSKSIDGAVLKTPKYFEMLH